MAKLEPEAAEIIMTLLAIIAEEFEEVPDDMLAEHCGYVWDGVSEAVQYLMRHGYDVPIVFLDLIARFFCAAGNFE